MMRQKREYRIFTFHTTAAAMEMEAFCREQGIGGRLVPVPRELSAELCDDELNKMLC